VTMMIRLSSILFAGLFAVPLALGQDSFGQQQQQQGQWPQQQPQQQGQWPQQQPQQQGQWPQQQPQQQGQWPQQQPQQQGQWPQQGGQQPGQQGQWSSQGSAQPNPLEQLVQMELQELGVPAQNGLKSGDLGGPTPTSIPGGRVITTPELLQLLNNPQGGAMVFDVLGGQQRLPNAIDAVSASAGGSFSDRTQRQFESQLERLTGGQKQVPMVFYCSSINCWMSYNAALRAIHAGYSQVYWYRGGLQAWDYMAQMSMQFSADQGQGQAQRGGW
jgi:rhodanese-related sulfurtransferase